MSDSRFRGSRFRGRKTKRLGKGKTHDEELVPDKRNGMKPRDHVEKKLRRVLKRKRTK